MDSDIESLNKLRLSDPQTMSPGFKAGPRVYMVVNRIRQTAYCGTLEARKSKEVVYNVVCYI